MLVPPISKQYLNWTKASVLTGLLVLSPATNADLAENLKRLFGGRIPQKPCIIAVSPMIEAGNANQLYKISSIRQAHSFAIQVEANTQGLGNYKKIGIKSNKVPKLCKQLMWTTQYSTQRYQQCMTQWAAQANTKNCKASETFVMGVRLPLTGKNARLIVKNKHSGRVVSRAIPRGNNKQRLARNIGGTIRKAIQQYKQQKK